MVDQRTMIGMDFGALEARTVLHFGGRRVGKTDLTQMLRETFEHVAATKPVDQPLIVNSDQYKRFLAAGVPAHRMHVPERIPVTGPVYVRTRDRSKSEFWRLAGPDTVIEPLGAGLSRILSRGAAQPVRYPRGG